MNVQDGINDPGDTEFGVGILSVGVKSIRHAQGGSDCTLEVIATARTMAGGSDGGGLTWVTSDGAPFL